MTPPKSGWEMERKINFAVIIGAVSMGIAVVSFFNKVESRITMVEASLVDLKATISASEAQRLSNSNRIVVLEAQYSNIQQNLAEIKQNVSILARRNMGDK